MSQIACFKMALKSVLSAKLFSFKIIYIAFSFAICALIVWLSIGVGLGSWQNPTSLSDITLSIRIPRIIVALIVGGCLAAAGAALQALFENPLADPSLIGTSGGAALGVVLVLAFGTHFFSIPLAAFIGALSVCLIILVAHKFIGAGVLGLLILGFVISAFCGALASIILFLSNDLVLRSATNWLAGSLAEAGFISPYYALSVAGTGLLILCLISKKLDILMLGEEAAISMGISINLTRFITIIGAALLTGAAVSLSGIIGFLGMMIPNIIAKAVGGVRIKIILLSAFLGAMFLLVIDSLSRLITYPIDVPVGIVIALLGGPFFLWLFIQRARV